MGAWIEIGVADFEGLSSLGRTPRWVRGLKSFIPVETAEALLSHPTMGAWIEI